MRRYELQPAGRWSYAVLALATAPGCNLASHAIAPANSSPGECGPRVEEEVPLAEDPDLAGFLGTWSGAIFTDAGDVLVELSVASQGSVLTRVSYPETSGELGGDQCLGGTSGAVLSTSMRLPSEGFAVDLDVPLLNPMGVFGRTWETEAGDPAATHIELRTQTPPQHLFLHVTVPELGVAGIAYLEWECGMVETSVAWSDVDAAAAELLDLGVDLISAPATRDRLVGTWERAEDTYQTPAPRVTGLRLEAPQSDPFLRTPAVDDHWRCPPAVAFVVPAVMSLEDPVEEVSFAMTAVQNAEGPGWFLIGGSTTPGCTGDDCGFALEVSDNERYERLDLWMYRHGLDGLDGLEVGNADLVPGP